MKKYLKVMLVLAVVLSVFCTFAMASTNPFEIKGQGSAATNSASVAINNLGYVIIDIIQKVGYVVAVVMVLVLGIQWLVGTPAKKQELKGKMWNVLIGAFLIIAGVTILGVINNVVNESKQNVGIAGNVTAGQQN